MSVSINIDKVVKKYGDTVVVNGLSVDAGRIFYPFRAVGLR